MFKSKYILVIASLFTIGTIAFAGDDSPAGKNFCEKFKGIRVLVDGDPHNPQPKGLNLATAIKVCPPGYHLPSNRDFANFAICHGAEGIYPQGLIDSGQASEEYLYHATNFRKIWQNAIRGQESYKTDFYYSEKHYIRPNGRLGKNWFWTANGYTFSGETGFLSCGWSENTEWSQIATACFLN